MSKVSVIIPVYNTEKFLRKCLDSVCNQTLQDIEIICINDCSTDGSLEILREYAGKDNRIKLIELFENGGAAKARNIGIDIAHGEYIGFVDSDDFVDLDFYEKYLLNAGQAERDKYIEEHPDFLNDYPVSYEHRELLQDELYRKLLRRIRAYETGEKAEKKE